MFVGLRERAEERSRTKGSQNETEKKVLKKPREIGQHLRLLTSRCLRTMGKQGQRQERERNEHRQRKTETRKRQDRNIDQVKERNRV